MSTYNVGLTIDADASQVAPATQQAARALDQLSQQANLASAASTQAATSSSAAAAAAQSLAASSAASAAAMGRLQGAATSPALGQHREQVRGASAAQEQLRLTARGAGNAIVRLSESASRAGGDVRRHLDFGSITASAAGFGQSTGRASSQLGRFGATLRGIDYRGYATRAALAVQAHAEMSASAGAAGSAMAQMKAVLVGFAGLRFAQSLKDAALAADAIDLGLKAATGSAEAAQAEYRFVAAEADRLGISLRDVAPEFTAFAAAARGTALEGEGVREVWSAVAETMVALGRPASDQARSLLALQQIVSKGTVQAEELRQQLGEALPGAFQIAARAMGVTTAELNKMLEQGEVLADEFLPRFAAELRRSFTAGEDATNGARAAFGRYETALFQFQTAVARGGFLDGVTEAVRSLTDAVADPAVVNAVSGVAAAVADVTAAAAANLDVIAALAAGYVAARAATIALTIATRAFNASMRLNPVGLAITAIGALAAGYVSLQTEIGRTNDLLDSQVTRLRSVADQRVRNNALAAKGQAQALAADVALLKSEQATIERQLKAAETAFAKQFGDGSPEAIAKASKVGAGINFRAADEARMALEEIEAMRAAYAELATQIAQTQQALFRAGEGTSRDIPGQAPPLGAANTGKKPKRNAFAESAAATAQEIADIQRLNRARQVSAEFEQLVRIEIEATAVAQRAATQARAAGIEVTRQEELELKALVAELITAKEAEKDRTRAIEEANRAAERAAQIHAQTVAEITAQLDTLDPSYERAVAAADRWREQALAGLDETAAGYEQFAADVERVHAEQLKRAYDEDLERRKDWSAGVERALKRAEEASGDWASVAEKAFDGVNDSAKEFFLSLAEGEASIGSFFDALKREAASAVFDQTLGPLFRGGFAGIFEALGETVTTSGIPSGSVSGGRSGAGSIDLLPASFHSGGVVGSGGGPRRAMPMSAFANAARYHEGGNVLGPGEEPIVALKGERVLTEAGQDNTARSLQAMAEGLRSAMALAQSGGGAVAAMPQIAIHNHMGGEAQANVSQQPGGGLRIDFERMVTERVENSIAGNVARGQGPLSSGLRRAGVPTGLRRPRGVAS